MSIHVYECPAGHRHEVIEHISEDKTGKRCYAACEVSTKPHNPSCHRKVFLSASVPTGVPKLKRGIGGFHKPNA